MSVRSEAVPLVLAAGLAVAALGCARALQASDCAWDQIHHSYRAPSDLGAGLVVHEVDWGGYHGAGPWAGHETLVTDCASGEVLALTGFSEDDGTPPAELDTREAVTALIDAAGPEPTLDALEGRARTGGIPARRQAATGETCGCRVFYPGLRGDKTPYPEAT